MIGIVVVIAAVGGFFLFFELSSGSNEITFAVSGIEQRALNGDSEAAHQLAISLISGDGTKESIITGLAWLSIAQSIEWPRLR
jgi:hypothetical protein